MAGPVWAIVVAAGSGNRFGGLKQFSLLAGRPLVVHALEAVTSVDGVVLVLPEGGELVGELFGLESSDAAGLPRALPPVTRVAGRSTRAGSVRAGLAAVPADCEVVVVHDAARPLATRALTEAVVSAVQTGAAGAIPAMPVSDTVKRVEGDVVVATVDRVDLVAVQTPQAFDAAALRAAHLGEPEATDDAGLVEAAGGRVVVVPGLAENLKVTNASDLEVAGVLLAARQDSEVSAL